MKDSPAKLGVHIKTKSISESLKFYNAFEFEPVFAFGSEEFLEQFSGIPTAPESYNGVSFGIGNAVFEVADGHDAVKPEVFKETILSSKVSVFVDVESVDQVLEIAKKNGFEVAAPIREFHWGTREIVIKDPDGLIVVFREAIKK